MRWQIIIDNFLGGFAPAWYKETYPAYGNKTQAGAMTNIDLTNPGFLTQGPGLSNLTNGTQAAALTTLPKGILDAAVTADLSYAVGGAVLYSFSSTTVTNGATFPHAITDHAVQDGEDVCNYKGNLYYSYNYSGGGDIGKYDLSATFDDNWGSTVPSGAHVLQASVPHQMIFAGNGYMYISNGQYITSYDNSTFIEQALSLPTGYVISSIAWNSDRLWIAANRPSLTGSNKNVASVFIWDGTTSSWETEIRVMGMVGGLHVKNGVLFIYYQDITSTGGYKLGYVNGSAITDLANFSGGLPAYYQITDYKDFLLWNSNGDLYTWGAGDKDMPVRLFQIADGGYSTVGGISCPFSTPIVASNQSTSYKIAAFSGYDTNSSWKSLLFDITGQGKQSRITEVRINFEALASGARVDWSLVNNKGTTVYSDTISYAKLGAATSAYYAFPGKVTENFRVQLDYSSGSTSNPVKVKNIKIYGTTD